MFLGKVVNLKDFSRPNKKKIKFSFKDFHRIQGLFNTTTKIQDLFKIAQTVEGYKYTDASSNNYYSKIQFFSHQK